MQSERENENAKTGNSHQLSRKNGSIVEWNENMPWHCAVHSFDLLEQNRLHSMRWNCWTVIISPNELHSERDHILKQNEATTKTHTHESRHSVHILFPLYFSFSFETIYEIKESNFILLAVMSSNDDCLSNVKHSHHSFKCTIFSSSLIWFVWSDSFQESFNCVRVCVCTRNIKPDWQPHHHHHQ